MSAAIHELEVRLFEAEQAAAGAAALARKYREAIEEARVALAEADEFIEAADEILRKAIT